MSASSFRSLAGIPDSTASPTDTALLIIDAQNEYLSGALAVKNGPQSSAVIADLLKKWRSANGKIIHVLHKVPEGTPVFTPGTKLAEEIEGVEAKEGEPVIWKLYPGSFAETELQAKLKEWGVQKVALVGYMAHVCISTTAREAHQKGFQVVLVEDGISDRDIPGVSGEEVTRVALAELNDFFGTVVKSSDIN